MTRKLAKVVAGAALALGMAAALHAPSQAQSDSICAVVKLEILQQATLEREAFDAHLMVNNNLVNYPLENFKVKIFIKDSNGNPVDAQFFVKPTSMTGLGTIDGGVIQSSSTADIHWLIIPSSGTGGLTPAGQRYAISAAMSGRSNGADQNVTTFDAFITVHPMPVLKLEYALPYEVFGQEPMLLPERLTPVEPFPLAARVTNIGYGVARNFQIQSAQPRILDNKQGLDVDFKILGTSVAGQAIPNTLLIPFGDISPNAVSQASWIMSATLSGRFDSFTSTFSHAADLGGQLTSLMQSVETYTLVKDVLVDLPGRDQLVDYLVNASTPRGEDTMKTPLDNGTQPRAEFILESDQAQALPVLDDRGTLTGTLGGASTSLEYALGGLVGSNVWVRSYAPISAANAEGAVLTSARRADGKVIAPANVWISKHFHKTNKEYMYWVNLFDRTGSTNVYTLQFSPKGLEAAPPAVTDLSAAPAPAPGAALLSWTSPAYNGSLLGARYLIQAGLAPDSAFSPSSAQVNLSTSTPPGVAQALSVPDLLGNATYYFHLWTQDGGGGISGLSNAATSYVYPYPPSGFQVAVATGSANVTWEAGNNRLPILYGVSLSTSAGGLAVSTSPFKDSFSRSFLFKGLTPNTSYYLTGLAKNPDTLAASLPSAENVFLTSAAAPSRLGYAEVSTRSATARWSPGPNPSDTEFSVELSTGVDRFPAFASGWVRASSFTFTGLSEGATYYGRVMARSRALVQTPYTDLGALLASGSDALAPRTGLAAEGPLFSSGALYAAGSTFLSLAPADDWSALGDGAGVGVARTYIAIDAGDFQLYGGGVPASALGEGLHTLRYYSVDAATPTHTEDLGTAQLAVDLTAPVTTLQAGGAPVADASSATASAGASLALLAADPVAPVPGGVASGTGTILYVIDADPASEACGQVPYDPAAPAGTCANEEYLGPFQLAVGSHTVYYFSEDNVGNQEATRTALVEVLPADVLPPRTELVAGAPSFSSDRLYVSSATSLGLAATDDFAVKGDSAGVGAALTWVSTDSVSYLVYSGSVTAADLHWDEGQHSLGYYSVDRSTPAHAEEPRSALLFVDLTPPLTQLLRGDTALAGPEPLAVSASAQLTLSAADAASGVAAVHYAVDQDLAQPACAEAPFDPEAAPGTCGHKAYGGPFTLPAGSHFISYAAQDRAGNREAVRIASFTVLAADVLPPRSELVLGEPSFEWDDYPYVSDQTGLGLSVSDDFGVRFDSAGAPGSRSYVAIDSSAFSLASGTVTLSDLGLGEGLHSVSFYSVDPAGHQESTRTVVLAADLTRPQTTLQVSGSSATAADGSLAITAAQTLLLSAADPAPQGLSSEVDAIYYTVDENLFDCWDLAQDTAAALGTCANQEYEGPFKVSAGTHTLYYAAQDMVGNVEAVRAVALTVSAVDELPPRTSLSWGGPGHVSDRFYVNAQTTFSLTAVDDYAVAYDSAGAGVAQTWISSDTASFARYGGEFSAASLGWGEGAHTLRFYSVDASAFAHAEESRDLAVALDMTPPATQLLLGGAAASQLDGLTACATTQFAFAASDPATADLASGLAATYYAVDSAPGAPGWGQEYLQPFVLSAGTHTLSFWSRDLVGNAEGARTATVAVSPEAAPVQVAGTLSLAAGFLSGDVVGIAVSTDGFLSQTVHLVTAAVPGQTLSFALTLPAANAVALSAFLGSDPAAVSSATPVAFYSGAPASGLSLALAPDAVPPTGAITSIPEGAALTALASLSGTSQDDRAVSPRMRFAVQDLGQSDLWWDGAGQVWTQSPSPISQVLRARLSGGLQAAAWSIGVVNSTSTGQELGGSGFLTAGHSYRLFAWAQDMAANQALQPSSAAFSWSASTGGAQLPAPAFLAGQVLGASSIAWTWALVQGATGYALYPSSGAAPMPYSSTDSYVATGLSPNTAYAPCVAGADASGPGLMTCAAPLFTWAVTPGQPEALAVSSYSITWAWSASSNPAGTSYELALSTDGFQASFIPAISSGSFHTGLTATVYGLSADTAYWAAVRAVNGNGAVTSLAVSASTRTSPSAGSTASGSIAGTIFFGVPIASGTMISVAASTDMFHRSFIAIPLFATGGPELSFFMQLPAPTSYRVGAFAVADPSQLSSTTALGFYEGPVFIGSGDYRQNIDFSISLDSSAPTVSLALADGQTLTELASVQGTAHDGVALAQSIVLAAQDQGTGLWWDAQSLAWSTAPAQASFSAPNSGSSLQTLDWGVSVATGAAPGEFNFGGFSGFLRKGHAYRLTAQSRDLAGNLSAPAQVSFTWQGPEASTGGEPSAPSTGTISGTISFGGSLASGTVITVLASTDLFNTSLLQAALTATGASSLSYSLQLPAPENYVFGAFVGTDPLQVGPSTPLGFYNQAGGVVLSTGAALEGVDFSLAPDAGAPSVSILQPVNGSTLTALPSLQGSAQDDTAVSARMLLAVQDLGSGGVWWDGTQWAASTGPVRHALRAHLSGASLRSPSWSLDVSSSAWPAGFGGQLTAGHAYRLYAVAQDMAANQALQPASVDFTWSPSSGAALPAAPAFAHGQALGVSSIAWTWALVDGATGYSLYASSNGPSVGTVAGDSYVSAGLAMNTAYQPCVAAVNASGTGPMTCSAPVYTWAAVPGQPQAVFTSSSAITWAWSASSNPAGTYYELALSTDGFQTSVIPEISAASSYTATSAAISGLLPGTLYWAAVRAVNGGGLPTSLAVSGSTRTLPDPNSLAANPSAGPIGIPFTLTGTGFGAYNGANTRVRFGARLAPISVWNNTTISGSVPGLSAGDYAVNIERQNVSSVTVMAAGLFTVTLPSATVIAPAAAPIGSPFTITGTSFGSYNGANTRVRIGSKLAPISVWNDTTIQGTIPGLNTGTQYLFIERATADGGLAVSATAYFTVLSPSVAQLSVSSGPIGIPFTLTGTGFGPYNGANTRVRIGDKLAPISVWNDTTITGTIPGLNAGTQYLFVERVTSDGGLAQSATSYFEVTVPTILGGNPLSGPIGIPFTLTGTSFGPYNGANTTVLLGGVSAPISVWTDTTIKGTIPGAVATGPQPTVVRRVTADNGLSQSATVYFTVLGPSISSLSPSTAPIGVAFTITGESFGTYNGANTRVKFGSLIAPISAWTDTSIQGTVPGLSSGPYTVSVELQAGAGLALSNPVSFLAALPEISTMSPVAGPISMPFTITGASFGPYNGANTKVLVAGVPAPISVWNDTMIKGTIPGTAPMGLAPVVVERATSDGGLSQSASAYFMVTGPAVAGIVPSTGPIGTPFSITGLSFGPYDGANTRVKIGGVTAPISSWDDDSIQGTIPGLPAGSHSVIVERQAGASVAQSEAGSFLVVLPQVASVSPSSAPIGTPFSITGTGFGAYNGANTRVKIGDVSAPISVWNDTFIQGTIPGLNAGTRYLFVERATPDGGLAVSATSYLEVTVPAILGGDPLSGPIGIPFTLTGTSFGPFNGANTTVLLGGVAAPISVWTDTTIKGTIPGAVATGPQPTVVRRITADGGLSQSATVYFTVQGPSISAFTPSTAPIGVAFTITGQSFGTYNGANTRVKFGSLTAPISVWNDTSIQGTVPGLSSGHCTVSVELQAGVGLALSNSAAFLAALPEISTFTPASGPMGVPFTLSGLNFGAYNGANTRVKVGGVPAPISVWNNTTISGTMPALDAGAQAMYVERATADGGLAQSSTVYFTVVAPSVAQLNPSTGPIGIPFTITGGGFGPYNGANTRVKFGAIPAPISVWNDAQIKGTIPGLAPGSYAVMVERQAGAGLAQGSAGSFYVSLPMVSTMSPAAAPIGAPFTITGTGFGPYNGANTKVKIGGFAAPISVWNDATIQGRIPGQVSSGSQTVVVERLTADGGVADSAPMTLSVVQPQISLITPPSADPPGAFQLDGTGFGPYSGAATKVLFGTTAAALSLWNNTTIRGVAPASLSSGTYSVTVLLSPAGGSVQSNAVTYTVGVVEGGMQSMAMSSSSPSSQPEWYYQANLEVPSSEGGSVTAPSRAAVTVPPLALDTTTSLTIDRAPAQGKDNAAREHARGQAALARGGDELEFGPEGTRFTVPVTIELPFDASWVPEGAREALAVHYWDPNTKTWLALRSEVDPERRVVRAQTDHFSLYQAMLPVAAVAAAAASDTVATIQVACNPLRQSCQPMRFRNLPAHARVRIYTLTGALVKDLNSDGVGQGSWDGTNQSGAWVASGVYFIFAQGNNTSKTIKVAVQR